MNGSFLSNFLINKSFPEVELAPETTIYLLSSEIAADT